ncbi:MAG: iron-sulfur cluster assembly accessory protein [Thiohalocapsa sp.]|jgi:iron-sulfur cluster insertion protein|uniref:HesB/IscA family protein n=1 Tax=Thiohalocapsa sp. TaxID=2497641 RepID=UPI0025F8121C|nr:iron-sulfur cluster assembly accessory protein [Thiohalocapsa sp.]MCG6939716.1 iron-sulfur cluster assembly accessory protein [Thiohalocapsa sp.]
MAVLNDTDLTLTGAAQRKMSELFADIDDGVAGVRVYATSGGCSGVSFGMTFTDAINDNDGVRDYDDYKIVVDDGTLTYLRGVEIDFVDRGDGQATFVFNNLPAMGGGCSSCGSNSGSCS